ncbi:MAG TPA: hypothetical protein P5514_07320 [Bacteroidales bacterium]|nr:hypothetical protein [Bacteroidales bacterium]HRX96738.1 hypothetical protein [Bacteroidales bacterium]
MRSLDLFYGGLRPLKPSLLRERVKRSFAEATEGACLPIGRKVELEGVPP